MGLTLIENTHVVVVQSITDADTITVIEEPKQVVVNASPDIVTVETLAGVQGEQGPPNTLTVGTVQSGPAPDVTITGTSPNQVVNFTMEKGDTATVAVGTVTTGAPGSNANIINSGTANDAVLDFAIPRGDKGDKGDKGDAATIAVGTTSTGAPGTPASVTNSGTAGDAVFDFVVPEGLKGDKGDAATIAVGTVTTGVAGSSVIITNSGDSGDAVFDFTVPRGDKGETGNTGPVGPPNVLSVGTVTSVPNGTAPTVTITGTSPAQTINFSLEQGPRGDNVEWHNSTGAPTSGIGGIGDYYLNRTNGDVYEKTDATTWVFRTNIVGPAGEGSIDTVNGYAGPDVTLTFTDVGAEPSGAVASHEADTTNIHGISDTANLVYTNDARLSDARTPTAHTHTKAQITDFAHGHIIGDVTGLQAALDSKEGVIAAGTTSQYYRGDKTWQTLNKAAVGLANVDNTSDASKPISTATQTALDGKANTSHTHTKSQITDFAHTHLIADLPVAASGTSSATLLVRADDSRLSDARTPTAHVHNASDINAGTLAIARIPVAASGTSSTTQVVRADDSRLSDARTPTAHTHTKANITDFAHVHAAADITSGIIDGNRLPATVVYSDNASTITGAKTFNVIPNLGISGINSLNGSQLTSASLRVWHDRLRFTSPVYETSADGVTWTTHPAGSGNGVFSGRSDLHVDIAADVRYARWTWNDSSISWASIQRLVLKFGYVNPAPNVNITVTSSPDGTTWNTRGTATANGTSANQFVMALADHGAEGIYRVQLQVVGGPASGAAARVNGVELQTPRWGDQGSAMEREWPFRWNTSKDIWFSSGVIPESTNAQNIGQSDKSWNYGYFTNLVLTNPLPQTKTHGSADTDTGTTAIHHTLGTGANQAAAGNHTHTKASITDFAHTHAIADLPVATSGTSSATQLVRADDSRLSDARTPTAHTHAITDVTNLQSSLDAKAAAVHSHSASDITSGIISQDRLVPNIVRVVHNGTDYPARPSGVTYVEWVGPTEPPFALADDTWVSTA